jgi:thiol-disulfide isomerase/thioredoxin
MVMTPSTMLPLGTLLPTFTLPDSAGHPVSADDFTNSPGLLVMFLCNHCPFVKHIRGELARFALRYQKRGLAIVAINSNDARAFPEDGPEMMLQEAQQAGYRFPYLYDETQEVAKSFRAACTPDFFLFDHRGRLVYRGQFDDSRPGNDLPVTGADLAAAVDSLLDGREVDPIQKPSIGCNIKWKPGNEPDYFDP